jgi:hypothetical protein
MYRLDNDWQRGESKLNRGFHINAAGLAWRPRRLIGSFKPDRELT